MRMVVGAIALLLAPAVYLLSGAQPLTSISISYWTDARDVFVGALIAVGFFLSAYNGAGERLDLEFYLSKASCVFAICVALFPTTGFGPSDSPPAWVANLSSVFGLMPKHVHYGAAVLLFACLMAMMWFFSYRAINKGKLFRANLYRGIAVAMLFGILLIGGVGYACSWPPTILVVEVWGLSLFGIGWLLAGAYKTEPDNER